MLLVNPYDVTETAEALHQALTRSGRNGSGAAQRSRPPHPPRALAGAASSPRSGRDRGSLSRSASWPAGEQRHHFFGHHQAAAAATCGDSSLALATAQPEPRRPAPGPRRTRGQSRSSPQYRTNGAVSWPVPGQRAALVVARSPSRSGRAPRPGRAGRRARRAASPAGSSAACGLARCGCAPPPRSPCPRPRCRRGCRAEHAGSGHGGRRRRRGQLAALHPAASRSGRARPTRNGLEPSFSGRPRSAALPADDRRAAPMTGQRGQGGQRPGGGARRPGGPRSAPAFRRSRRRPARAAGRRAARRGRPFRVGPSGGLPGWLAWAASRGTSLAAFRPGRCARSRLTSTGSNAIASWLLISSFSSSDIGSPSRAPRPPPAPPPPHTVTAAPRQPLDLRSHSAPPPTTGPLLRAATRRPGGAAGVIPLGHAGLTAVSSALFLLLQASSPTHALERRRCRLRHGQGRIAARHIDVTHLIPPGDVRRGAAVLAQTVAYLPPPVVHVARSTRAWGRPGGGSRWRPGIRSSWPQRPAVLGGDRGGGAAWCSA